jgi:hypothetical protein
MRVVPAKTTKAKKKQEVTAIGQALRALGGLGGGYAGSYLGNPGLGAAAGTGFGAMVSKWLGQGDYTVSANSLLNSVRPDGTIPSMHKDGQSIVVRHKEFLGEITGSTAYTVQKRFSINPGDPSTFPWLAAIAAQYTEYKVRGMIYHYIPTSGMAVSTTNPALGSVMIQTSYRATEDAPVSKVEMMNEYWATEARPSEAFCHPIECDPKENPFNVQYIRSASVASTENVLMYDLGVTTVATSGCPASGNVLGDLWCTYEIELKKPKLANLNTESALTASIAAQGALTATEPFLTQRELFTSVPGIIATSTGFTVPKETIGTYLIVFTLYNASTIANPTFAFGTGIVGKFVTVNAVGSSSGIATAVVNINPHTTTRAIVCACSSLTGASVIASLRMTEYNSNADF